MRQLPDRPASVRVLTFAMDFDAGTVLPDHAHDWDQLVLASDGVMTVETADGAWVVPPQRAVWVPAGVVHKVEMSGTVSMRTLYLRPGLARSLPSGCCVVSVTPLLRELCLSAVARRALDTAVPEQERLCGVLLDQLEALGAAAARPVAATPAAAPLELPLPRDPRALRVAAVLRDDPATAGTLDELAAAASAGASRRTLERLFRTETGMSFGRWRQQLRLLSALRLLAAGRPVTAIALDVGYDSASAFIGMFKKHFGTTPARYYDRATRKNRS